MSGATLNAMAQLVQGMSDNALNEKDKIISQKKQDLQDVLFMFEKDIDHDINNKIGEDLKKWKYIKSELDNLPEYKDTNISSNNSLLKERIKLCCIMCMLLVSTVLVALTAPEGLCVVGVVMILPSIIETFEKICMKNTNHKTLQNIEGKVNSKCKEKNKDFQGSIRVAKLVRCAIDNPTMSLEGIQKYDFQIKQQQATLMNNAGFRNEVLAVFKHINKDIKDIGGKIKSSDKKFNRFLEVNDFIFQGMDALNGCISIKKEFENALQNTDIKKIYGDMLKSSQDIYSQIGLKISKYEGIDYKNPIIKKEILLEVDNVLNSASSVFNIGLNKDFKSHLLDKMSNIIDKSADLGDMRQQFNGVMYEYFYNVYDNIINVDIDKCNTILKNHLKIDCDVREVFKGVNKFTNDHNILTSIDNMTVKGFNFIKKTPIANKAGLLEGLDKGIELLKKKRFELFSKNKSSKVVLGLHNFVKNAARDKKNNRSR